MHHSNETGDACVHASIALTDTYRKRMYVYMCVCLPAAHLQGRDSFLPSVLFVPLLPFFVQVCLPCFFQVSLPALLAHFSSSPMHCLLPQKQVQSPKVFRYHFVDQLGWIDSAVASHAKPFNYGHKVLALKQKAALGLIPVFADTSPRWQR